MKSVVILIALLGFGGVAYAKPERVDWSEYLETKSDKPLVLKSSTPKAAKASPKHVASKAKKPTKKRTAARAKKRR